MDLPVLFAWLVTFIALPLNWIVTVLLWRLVRMRPGLRVLRERAVLATALSFIVTVFAFIFWNNDLSKPLLTLDQTKIISRGAILAFSTIPALYWLRTVFRRGV